MINDDDRDYAEERANLADMRREQEGEAAHEQLVDRVLAALRALSVEAHTNGTSTASHLAGEVHLRRAPNAHRYELLARQQHIALLAATTANAIEERGGYVLLADAQGVAEGYTATHGPADPSDLLGRALRDACARVIGTVQSVLDDDEQAQQDARDAADLAETEAYLRRVTR